MESVMLENLRQQTVEFKEDYIATHTANIKSYYQKIIDTYNFETVEKVFKEDIFGIGKTCYNGRIKTVYDWIRSDENKQYQKVRSILYHYEKGELDKIIERNIKDMVSDFELKEVKLISRLVKLGLTEKFKIELHFASPNLEGFAQEDDKFVKIRTIIAEGEIQRPHYRYLATMKKQK